MRSYLVEFNNKTYFLKQFTGDVPMMPLLNQLHLAYDIALKHANTLIPKMHNTVISKEELKLIKRAVKGLSEYTDILALSKKFPENHEILYALDEWAWSVEAFIFDNGPAHAIKHSYKVAYKLIDKEQSK
jgi:hypothetical protein